MILGKVVGTVWGGKEAVSLGATKLLQIRPVAFSPGQEWQTLQADANGIELSQRLVIAADSLGAGIGEFVLVAHGSRVRDLTEGKTLPTKEVVIAIVDSADVDTDLFPDGETR